MNESTNFCLSSCYLFLVNLQILSQIKQNDGDSFCTNVLCQHSFSSFLLIVDYHLQMQPFSLVIDCCNSNKSTFQYPRSCIHQSHQSETWNETHLVRSEFKMPKQLHTGHLKHYLSGLQGAKME